jgi:hypothetical protein
MKIKKTNEKKKRKAKNEHQVDKSAFLVGTKLLSFFFWRAKCF